MFFFFICDSRNIVVIVNTIIVIRVSFFNILQFCGWIGVNLVTFCYLVVFVFDLFFFNFDFFFFVNLSFFILFVRFSSEILQFGSINSCKYVFIKGPILSKWLIVGWTVLLVFIFFILQSCDLVCRENILASVVSELKSCEALMDCHISTACFTRSVTGISVRLRLVMTRNTKFHPFVPTLEIWERSKTNAIDGARCVGIRRVWFVVGLDIGAEGKFTMFVEIERLPSENDMWTELWGDTPFCWEIV
jgi:hypothetical protein